jgi:hypothetical protein
MTVTPDTLAELAALERALTRVPTRAFGDGEAMVEWTDGLRQRLRELRVALTPEAVRAAAPPRPAVSPRPGSVRTPKGSVIPFEVRRPRRPR